jgi:6-phosphogluconolactonase
MLTLRTQLHIVANAEELSRAAAEAIVRLAKGAVRARGSFAVALAGGSTPRSIYALLASEVWHAQLPWEKMHLFWGDERHVPPNQADSNYRMVHEAMLAHVPVPVENVHRIKAEDPNASQAAEEYEQTLRDFFHLAAGRFPRFDLVLLGMGSDGHTASLFPGTDALRERERLVVANWVEKFNSYRITLTAPTLNNSACVIFLVSGEEKAETLQAVWQGSEQPERFPVQLIRPTDGRLLWIVDRAAVRHLSESKP